MYLNSAGRQLILSETVQHWYGSEGYQTLWGTWENDLFHGTTNDILNGSWGGDTYYLWDSSTKVVEYYNEGIDVVHIKYWGNAVLPDNVENMVLASDGAIGGTGNWLDNIIIAGNVGATLNGLGGNDVLVGGSGADTFVIAAGNGSDVIENFQTGNDKIRLEGYGLSSFSAVMSNAYQSGGDTVVDLKNGETLTFRNVSLSNLSASDFGYTTSGSTTGDTGSGNTGGGNTGGNSSDVPAGDQQLSGAWAATNENGWYIINNMWGQGSLVEGSDFTINTYYNPDDMTAGTTFTWTLPYHTNSNFSIIGYPEVAFGVNPHGAHTGNPTDTANVFPIQLSSLTGLVADYDVSYQGNTSGFNVAYDIWFTSEPYGDASTITTEVMIWVHKGYFPAFGPVAGTYNNNGISGTIYHSGTYVALVLDQDLPSAQLDIADILDRLVELGLMSEDEYLASLDFGAEIVSGNGSLTINNLDLTVKTSQDDGSTLVKEVTGAGTTVTVVPADDNTNNGSSNDTPPDNSTGDNTPPDDSTSGGNTPDDNSTDDNSTDTPTSDTPASGGHSLTGTSGNDDIYATAGADIMSGGGGADIFYFQDALGAGNVDQVLDYSRAEGDRIALNYEVFAGVGSPGSFDGRAFRLGDSAKDNTDHIIYNQETGQLFYDPDAFGPQAMVLFAQFAPGTEISGWDFIVTDYVAVPADTGSNDTPTETPVETPTETPSTGDTTTDDSTPDTPATDDTPTGGTSTDTPTTDDTSTGGTANDTPTSESHTLTGTAGADTLTSTTGVDFMTGGKGGDTFYFQQAAGSGNVDHILDFSRAEGDKIALNAEAFAGVGSPGSFDGRAFRVGDAALDNTDHIIYNQQTGQLFYDPDAFGPQAMVLFAEVTPGTEILPWDFAVYG